MARNDRESSLSSDPFRAAFDVMEEWERICDRDEQPDLLAYVKARPGLLLTQIATLIHMDQARRWHLSERPCAEGYFALFPELSADREAALDVIYGEYLLRTTTEASDAVLSDLVARFPLHAATLTAQVSLHSAIAKESDALNERPAVEEPTDDPAKTAWGIEETQGAPQGVPLHSAERTRVQEWLIRVVETGELSSDMESFADRYELRKFLGRGGMGVVVGGYDRKLARDVAIKMPRPDFASPHETSGRFEREARLAAQLTHLHLCPIYDVGRWRGITYLTMPYLTGPSLAERLLEGERLSIVEAVEITMKVADALEFAHARGIVHRDLKPANIMFNAAGEPIVMDFGLARYASTQESSLTVSGMVQGTPLYMAPEQWDDAPLGHRPAADIYSLGVMLYELLVGTPPFQGTYRQVTRQAILGQVEPPTQARAEIDETLSQICLRAMALDPEQRWRSMAEFSSALADWQNGQRAAIDNQAATQGSSRHGVTPLSRRRWAAGFLIVALFVLLLASGWSIRSWWPPATRVDRFPVGSVWEGSFVFRPPYTDYHGDLTIQVTRRDGDEWEATYATEVGQYQWLIAGTLKGDQIEWRTIDVIHEPEPRPQMRGARAKGHFDGATLRATIEIPGNGSLDVADIELTRHRERAAAP